MLNQLKTNSFDTLRKISNKTKLYNNSQNVKRKQLIDRQPQNTKTTANINKNIETAMAQITNPKIENKTTQKQKLK